MKPQIATTREQSARLLECGVDPRTSDMCWTRFESEDTVYDSLFVHDEYCYEPGLSNQCPSWTLSAILALLPKEIYGDDESMDSYYPSLAKDYPFKEDYALAYKNAWDDTGEALFRVSDESPIEACVKAIEWLVVNDYKLNESESCQKKN